MAKQQSKPQVYKSDIAPCGQIYIYNNIYNNIYIII